MSYNDEGSSHGKKSLAGKEAATLIPHARSGVTASRCNAFDRGNAPEDKEDEENETVVVSSSAALLSQSAILDRARWWIYISHFFSRFLDATWQFANSLFLAAFSNYRSLFLVSSYGIVSQLSVCALGATSGRLVDQNSDHRLTTVRLFLGAQTVSILIATICSYFALIRVEEQWLLQQQQQTQGTDGNNEDLYPSSSQLINNNDETGDKAPFAWWHDGMSVVLVLLIHVFGPLAELLNMAFLVAMERDWIVAMIPTANHSDSTNSTTTTPGSRTNLPSHAAAGLENNKSNTTAVNGRVWLTETNVRMKQLNLACKVVAPALAGWVIGAFDHDQMRGNDISLIHQTNNHNHRGTHDLTAAALMVGLVSILGVVVGFISTARVYHMIPALRSRAGQLPPQAATEMTTTAALSTETKPSDHSLGSAGVTVSDESERAPSSLFSDEERIDRNSSKTDKQYTVVVDSDLDDESDFSDGRQKTAASLSRLSFPFTLLPSSWRIYFQQPISYGGLGLSLLYVNALTFASLMTAYLVSRGMALETVGLLRGVASALGLFGTVAFHMSVSKTSLVTTGLWSIALEFVCLSICFVSFFVESYNGSMTLLVAGVCASRIGLWVFDISVTQMMQELVPEGIRGVMGGTQQSLNALFQFSSYALGLIFFDPADFYILAAAGYLTVGIALVLYYVGVYQRVNYLFPITAVETAAF